MQHETDYYVIYNKYFKNERAFKRRITSEYFSKGGGKILDKRIREGEPEIFFSKHGLVEYIEYLNEGEETLHKPITFKETTEIEV